LTAGVKSQGGQSGRNQCSFRPGEMAETEKR
jgi:hypothetical protein